MRGLVVEEHEDRIILSTVNGEIPVLRRGILRIEYDDPAQNFLQIGRAYEEKKRYGEALSYFDKALEVNPELEEAKKASVRVRNLYWAKAATGPVDEVERQQVLYESWGKDRLSEKQVTPDTMSPKEWLQKSMGLTVEKKGDWILVQSVSAKKDAWNAGLRKGDRLVSADGQSLRYLGEDAAIDKMLAPRLTTFTLEYDRSCRMIVTGFEKDIKEFGMRLKLESRGAVVTMVTDSSSAAKAGLKKGDLLVEVNGETTRYMAVKKILAAMQKDPSNTTATLSVRRSTLLTRR